MNEPIIIKTIIEPDPLIVKRIALNDCICVLCTDIILQGKKYYYKNGILNCDKGNSFYKIYKTHLHCHNYYLKIRQKLGDENAKEVMNRTENIFNI